MENDDTLPVVSSEEPKVQAYDYIPLTPGQERFYISERAEDARKALKELVNDASYTTDIRDKGVDGAEFIDRHLRYLSSHPNVELHGYLSNLRLMTSVKRRSRR